MEIKEIFTPVHPKDCA